MHYADEKIVAVEDLEPLEQMLWIMIVCLILRLPRVAAVLLL